MKIDTTRALEVLTACGYECPEIEELILAKQAKAEPVAWKDTCVTTDEDDNEESEAVLLGYQGWEKLPDGTDLYTHPPVAKPGWKLVPIEPSLTQISAGRIEFNRYSPMDKLAINGVYSAMIAAAPGAEK